MFEKTSREMLDFIAASPSCFHAAANLAAMLDSAGFQLLEEHEHWKLVSGGKYYVQRNSSAVIAFVIPEQTDCGFMIAAAHSDAPAFRLKECPELKGSHYVQLNVEKYGGAILAPWFDRPLSVAGRVMAEENGEIRTKLLNIDRDLVLIPNLAIHMNREVNNGVALNPQVDLLPLISSAGADVKMNDIIAAELKIPADRILASDLFLYVREAGRIWGAEREFISSPKLDDLQCAWSTIRGITEAEAQSINVAAVFDNEEVGSGTKQGADSTFLEDVLSRISGALGRTPEEHRISIAKSFMVSADNGHAIHPNHPEKADRVNFPVLNGGIVIKFSANQKYTTDAVSDGIFRSVCRKAGVPVQVYVNRSDIPGGSTLGNISTSHVSLNTVDIGLPQLAMHSCFETGGVKDTWYLKEALRVFYESALVPAGRGNYILRTGGNGAAL